MAPFKFPNSDCGISHYSNYRPQFPCEILNHLHRAINNHRGQKSHIGTLTGRTRWIYSYSKGCYSRDFKKWENHEKSNNWVRRNLPLVSDTVPCKWSPVRNNNLQPLWKSIFSLEGLHVNVHTFFLRDSHKAHAKTYWWSCQLIMRISPWAT